MAVRMTARTENDARELRTFERFLTELGAHREVERLAGRCLQFDTTTVPHEWWDPKGEFPRRHDRTEQPS